MQHGAEAFFEGELAEVFEFAGIEEDAVTTGAAVDEDVELLLVFGGDEDGAVARALPRRGGACAGAAGGGAVCLHRLGADIGIVLSEFVEFAGIEPDAAAGGAAIEGDFEWCADAKAHGLHHAGVSGAGEFPAILTRDKGHEKG